MKEKKNARSIPELIFVPVATYAALLATANSGTTRVAGLLLIHWFISSFFPSYSLLTRLH